MEINSPEQLMSAISLLMMQMNRGQRKQFLQWVKDKTTQFNFNYPEGYKMESKETTNAKDPVVEPIIVAPPVELIVPAVSETSSGIITGQGS